jgi:hypothetical protein
MFKKMMGAAISLVLACLMGLSIATVTATPAAAMKTGQAVLACAANLKCTDEVLDGTGEHVMCVKGGGCVVCPASSQGTCDAALRAHEVAITTDPVEILKGINPPVRKQPGDAVVHTGTLGKSLDPGRGPLFPWLGGDTGARNNASGGATVSGGSSQPGNSGTGGSRTTPPGSMSPN